MLAEPSAAALHHGPARARQRRHVIGHDERGGRRVPSQQAAGGRVAGGEQRRILDHQEQVRTGGRVGRSVESGEHPVDLCTGGHHALASTRILGVGKPCQPRPLTRTGRFARWPGRSGQPGHQEVGGAMSGGELQHEAAQERPRRRHRSDDAHHLARAEIDGDGHVGEDAGRLDDGPRLAHRALRLRRAGEHGRDDLVAPAHDGEVGGRIIPPAGPQVATARAHRPDGIAELESE